MTSEQVMRYCAWRVAQIFSKIDMELRRVKGRTIAIAENLPIFAIIQEDGKERIITGSDKFYIGDFMKFPIIKVPIRFGIPHDSIYDIP